MEFVKLFVLLLFVAMIMHVTESKQGRKEKHHKERKTSKWINSKKTSKSSSKDLKSSKAWIKSKGSKKTPKADCAGLPPPPINGAVNGTQYLQGDVITYHCNKGFVMNGENASTCQANGTWDHVNATTCRAVCAGLPQPPTNGAVNGTGHLQGDEVTYNCNEGYLLEEEKTSTCQSDGAWSNVNSASCRAVCPTVHLQASATPIRFVSHAGYNMSNYDDYTDGCWVIEARVGYTIDFSIKEMDIDNITLDVFGNHYCLGDYVEVFDGRNDTTATLGKYCGSTAPAAISSTGQYLLVHFHSDFALAFKGFEAQYEEGGQQTN